MSAIEISDYLKYAEVQMAAEAILIDPTTRAQFFSGGSLIGALQKGNEHASKFTKVAAVQFEKEWEVVAQKSNTSTGFSGTLFKNRATEELVLSFRSTEFIDDAVRDTQVTNKGIKETGWAFGQLADMQEWYKTLSKTGGPLDNKSFVVTGYSLGGHLATAFPLLCSGASAVYTFNGAGVGGLRDETLSSVVKTFQTLWKNAGKNSGLFKDPQIATIYKEYIKNNTLSAASTALLLVRKEWSSEAALLQSAIEHVADAQNEIARISNIDGAIKVAGKDIAGVSLDYWLGVFKAAQSTFSENVIQSTLSRTPPRMALSIPVYNLYGMETANPFGNPSGVSNSQNHYGTDVPIFIESQPMSRGGVGLSALWQSALYTDIKLLVPNFTQNDFGDSHSLVLLVDSLAVQGLFSQLDSTATVKQLQDIFGGATATRPETSIGGQGKAEGYTLEAALDGLIKTLIGTDPKLRDIKTLDSKSLDTGNTWHDIDARQALHKAIADLKEENSYKALLGKVTLVTPATGVDAARTDFGQFLALVNLTPFALKVTDTTALAALKGGNEALAQAWESDAQLRPDQRTAGLGNYSNTWLIDRADMLSNLIAANEENTMDGMSKRLRVDVESHSPVYFLDIESGVSIQQTNSLTSVTTGPSIQFGGVDNDALNGFDEADYLYGGEGDDTLIGFVGSDHLEGGAGKDTYLVDASGGGDLIVDSDGQGIIKWSVGGTQYALAGGKKLSDGTWKSTDGRFVYSLVANTAGQKDLNVMADGGVLRVRNYISGQLGIVLDAVEGQKAAGAGTNENDRLINTQGLGLVQAAGLAGNDLLVGAADSTGEWFDGGAGRDMLIGRMGNDTLSGGADADLIIGGNGSDVIDGGAGNDLILNGTRYKRAGSGSVVDHNAFTWDKPWLIYAPYWQWGSSTGATLKFKEPGSELIGWSWEVTMQTGAPDNNFGFTEDTYLPADSLALVGSDTILGGAGADMIAGSGGDDLIDGGGDDDLINGLEGNERILGGSGNDQIAGNEGKDLIDGGGGLDTLWGGIGADSIFGFDGADQIFGDFGVAPGIGADRYALSGNDFISGGDGDDLLSGDGGADTVFGDSGSDEIVGDAIALDATDHGDDELYGGSGGDTLYGLGGGDVLFGGADDDFLFGDSNAAESPPLAAQGNDWLDGGDGDDQLVGDGGSDTLIGGAGKDTLSGGDGDDVYVLEKGDFAVDGSGLAETIVDTGGEDVLLIQGYRPDELFMFNMIGDPGWSVLGSLSNESLALPYVGAGIIEKIFVQNSVGTAEGAAAPMTIAAGFVQVADSFWGRNYTEITKMELFGRSPFAMELYGETETDTDDALYGGMLNDVLVGFGGNDELYGQGGNDSLVGGNGNDILVGGAGSDSLSGGYGVDIFQIDQGFGRDFINNPTWMNGFNDVIRFGPGISSSAVSIYRNFQNLEIVVNSDNHLTISDFFPGASVITTPTGRIEFSDGVVAEYSEILNKIGPLGNDSQTEYFFGSSQGDDLSPFDYRNSNAIFFAFEGNDWVQGNPHGHDVIYGGDGNDSLYGDDRNEYYSYSGAAESPDAANKSDHVFGGAGDDQLFGCGGNDILDGGTGNDVLWGGKGSDTYIVNVGYGSDTLLAWEPTTVDVATDVLEFGANIKKEDISLLRLGDDLKVLDKDGRFDLTISNAFSGGGGINSKSSIDEFRFQGGTSWTISQMAEKVTYSTPGDDLIVLTGSFRSVYADAGDDDIQGSSFADTIYGDAGNDSLHGGVGVDSLVGGAGDDFYWVSNKGAELYNLTSPLPEDIVVEAVGEGTDTLITDTFSATLPDNVESLIIYNMRQYTYFDPDPALYRHELQGNSSDNYIDVSSIPRQRNPIFAIFGWGGADTLVGGVNDETYYIYSDRDVVIELGVGADGSQFSKDKVGSTVSFVLPENIEDLQLYGATKINGAGNGLANLIIGNDAANTLDGAAGVDTLRGGEGDDIYVVDNGDDVTLEYGSGGMDTVQASVTYTLSAEVENLTLTGTTAINGTGNALANVVTGNAAANILDGGAGNDTLSGGLGNNTYLFGKGDGQDYINALADAAPGKLNVLQLKAGIVQSEVILTRSGYDLVLSIAATSDKVTVQDFFYQDNPSSSRNPVQQVKFSDLTTWNVSTIAAKVAAPPAGNQILTGTSGPDTLRGGAGNDTLDGGAGNDTLIGGAGNDTYLVANAGDVVTEVAAGGTDTVQASVTYTLSVEVENLMLTGESAINGTGNTLANVITGNVVANILSGGAGADRLIGGAGADRLIGGVGADTLIGGVDNDIYLVDNLEDIVTEVAEGGTDTVMASITYSLSAEVENLALALFGGSAINGTGNALDNLITGNAAANTLDGGAGDDMLNGGSGDDTLIGGIGYDTCVGGVGDDTFMLVAGGSDLSGVDLYDGGVGINRVVGGWGDDILKVTNQLWNLVNIQSIEDSDATFGSNTILATSGNDSLDFSAMTINNFVIDGDAGNDVIVGTVGADRIRGGVGNDTLSGGRGDDCYLFGRGAGADVIGENDATVGNADVLLIDAGITVDQLWFRRIGSDLEISIIGTTDKATIGNWYSGSAYHVEQFKTADGKILLDGQVDALVSAMAAFSPPTAGQTTLSPALQATLNPVIAANWH